MHALTAVDALTSKTIFAQGESVVSTLNTNQSKAGSQLLPKRNRNENNLKAFRCFFKLKRFFVEKRLLNLTLALM
jgi:hypothetical protein